VPYPILLGGAHCEAPLPSMTTQDDAIAL